MLSWDDLLFYPEAGIRQQLPAQRWLYLEPFRGGDSVGGDVEETVSLERLRMLRGLLDFFFLLVSWKGSD